MKKKKKLSVDEKQLDEIEETNEILDENTSYTKMGTIFTGVDLITELIFLTHLMKN